MAAKSWTDNQINYCQCDQHGDGCRNIHEGDTLPERYAFWTKADKRGTYYTADNFADFLMELSDLADGEPFEKGEAVVRDLATKAQMDAAEFMRQFSRR